MLRIALCDDDGPQRVQLQELLERYGKARLPEGWQVEAFPCGQALLDQGNAFDLYLLDILMPEPNGIETARQLRRRGQRGEILFLTSSNDFAADSYDVGAFFYLLKPVKEEKLFPVLDRALEKLRQRQGAAIVVRTPQGPERLLLGEIRWVERVGRRMRYWCNGREVTSQTIRLPFKEMAAPLLEDRRFYLCGASFALNLEHVTGVKGKTALLDNGMAVDLPRTAASDFKKAWGQYWLEEGAKW